MTRPFELNADGTLTPPDDLGIGVEVDREMLAKMQANWDTLGQ